jgi:hypothetical protein
MDSRSLLASPVITRLLSYESGMQTSSQQDGSVGDNRLSHQLGGVSRFAASRLRLRKPQVGKREVEIGLHRQAYAFDAAAAPSVCIELHGLRSLRFCLEPQRLWPLRLLQPLLGRQPILFGESVATATGIPKRIGKLCDFIVQ